MATRSHKPRVIERIFDQLWDEAEQRPRRTMVTMQDVKDAIEWCNAYEGTKLSSSNPANFIKDIIRGSGASTMWPERLHLLRWTAEQETGGGNIFEFIPYEDGQTEAFPTLYGFRDGLTRHRVQSLSIPLASKELGREDETYLIQVAVKLALVETHFALESPLKVLELNHLQIGIKLRLTDIDSLYAATYENSHGEPERIVITCEAKSAGQRILEGQVRRQVHAAFEETQTGVIVPLAMAASDGGVYIVEFAAVHRADLANFKKLKLQSEALYELVPAVKGI